MDNYTQRSEQALKTATNSVLKKLKQFILKYKNCDILIATDDYKISENVIQQFIENNNFSSVYINNFNYNNPYSKKFLSDYKILECEEDFDYTTDRVITKIVGESGGITGYSVSSTSSGYSISPEYGPTTYKTVEEKITKNHTSYERVTIRVKAVKKGTALEVLNKEAAFNEKSADFSSAQLYEIYKSGKQNKRKHKPINFMKCFTYDFIFLLSVISFFIILVACVSLNFHSRAMFPSIFVKAFLPEVYANPENYINFNLHYIIVYVAFGINLLSFIYLKILLKYIENISFVLIEEKFLTKNIRKQIKRGSLLFNGYWVNYKRNLTINVNFFTSLAFLVLTVLFNIIHLVPIGFFYGLIISIIQIPMLICIFVQAFFIIYSFIKFCIGLFVVLTVPNYKRFKNYYILEKNFLESGEYEKYDNLLKEIKSYTVS